jgi:hypothetical protein
MLGFGRQNKNAFILNVVSQCGCFQVGRSFRFALTKAAAGCANNYDALYRSRIRSKFGTPRIVAFNAGRAKF